MLDCSHTHTSDLNRLLIRCSSRLQAPLPTALHLLRTYQPPMPTSLMHSLTLPQPRPLVCSAQQSSRHNRHLCNCRRNYRHMGIPLCRSRGHHRSSRHIAASLHPDSRLSPRQPGCVYPCTRGLASSGCASQLGPKQGQTGTSHSRALQHHGWSPSTLLGLSPASGRKAPPASHPLCPARAPAPLPCRPATQGLHTGSLPLNKPTQPHSMWHMGQILQCCLPPMRLLQQQHNRLWQVLWQQLVP